MASSHRFPFSPMSSVVLVLTVVLFALPVGFGLTMLTGDMPGFDGLLYVPVALLGLYGVVFFWSRPRQVVVTDAAVTIECPLRKVVIARTNIRGAEKLGIHDFQAECGWTFRVGIGGLFGSFGWLYTSHRGWLDMYVSRHDWVVLVECDLPRPLVVTPKDPDEFCRLLGARPQV